MPVLRSLIHRVRALSLARLLIAVVALSPVIERAVPDACDADGRALQVHVVSAESPDDGANDFAVHPVHFCHCAHAHAQMITGAFERVAHAEPSGRGFPQRASGVGRLADAPPARPPALA